MKQKKSAENSNLDALADIFDVVVHKREGITGIVRAVYPQKGTGVYVYDVEIEPGHITYGTVTTNWKKVASEDV